MIDVLLLRFDAPLMSFGGPLVDHRGFTQRFPGRAAITGLLANALGWDHRDAARTGALQSRLRIGARVEREGTPLVDFHTVGLGQAFMQGGWTTRGRAESRGGASSDETHIRERHYLADALYLVAVALEPERDDPDLDALERALREPERPLFLGRKACLPSAPILAGRLHAESVRDALERAPRLVVSERPLSAQWPDDGDATARLVAITDDRDWANQIHVGRRQVREGVVAPPRATEAAS